MPAQNFQPADPMNDPNVSDRFVLDLKEEQMSVRRETLSRRQLLKLAGASAAGMALAACAPGVVPQAGEGAAPAAEVAVIKFDAGGFTPSKYTGQQLQEGQADLVAFEVVADTYAEANPGVQIEFQPIPMGDRRAAAVTMLSAGTAPDISWAQPDWVNEDLGKGWWLALDPWMEMPSPYAPADHPARRAWYDGFYPSIDFWRAPDGNLYMLLGDQTALGCYYNKDLFEEAGVAEIPENWADWMAAAQAVQELGKSGFSWAGGGEAAIHQLTWISGWLSKYFFWDLVSTYDKDANGWPDKWEMADAIHDGTYSASMDEQVARLRTIKDMAQYWQEGALGMENEAIYRHFLGGDSGMCITGVWNLNRFLNDPGREYELGWFYFRPVTQITSGLVPEGVPMTNVASGYGSFQYSLTSTALENGTEDQAADFLMFATTPENITKIVSETPSTIPNVIGGQAHEITQSMGFAETVEYPASTFQEDDSLLDYEYGVNFTSVVLPYAVGQLSEEDMLAQLQGYMNAAADRMDAIRPQ